MVRFLCLAGHAIRAVEPTTRTLTEPLSFLPDTGAPASGQSHPALSFGKRATDVILSALLLVALAPVLLFVALMVRVTMGRPILFTQKRPGLGGRPFQLIKFRTMSDQSHADGRLLSDAERLPSVGRWLRSTSLDELPELINVLRGDMSLVGPRPLLMEYLPLYSPEQFRRHDVRPGLTGLAQISGRNALGWEEKFALDVRYVDQWSLALDWKIITVTAWKVLARQGIGYGDHPTAPKFEGKRSDR